MCQVQALPNSWHLSSSLSVSHLIPVLVNAVDPFLIYDLYEGTQNVQEKY
jgi:hypothetical protein